MEQNRKLISTSKRLFLRGLAALLPTVITLIILVKVVSFLNYTVGRYIGTGLTHAIAWGIDGTFYPTDDQLRRYFADKGITVSELDEDSSAKHRQQAIGVLRAVNMGKVARSWQMSVLGFLVAAVIVCIIGFMLASLIGRRLWQLVERTVTQLPIVKQIYPPAKQMTDYVFGSRRTEFSRVVMVQYPRKGLWSMGFITGPALSSLKELNEDYVTMFIPSSPTPLTGYTITVLKEETIDLPITVDQAFRYVISAGVLTPEAELVGVGNDREGTDGQKRFAGSDE